MPESIYAVVSVSAYIEGFVILNMILGLRGTLQLFTVFKVTLFHDKVILIKLIFLQPIALINLLKRVASCLAESLTHLWSG